MVHVSDFHYVGSPHTKVPEEGQAALHSNTPRLKFIHKDAQVKIHANTCICKTCVHQRQYTNATWRLGTDMVIKKILYVTEPISELGL